MAGEKNHPKKEKKTIRFLTITEMEIKTDKEYTMI